MIPGGVNPKQMKKMMKKMGIKMDEIDATEVIIRCVDKDIIIDTPQVVVTNMQGQTSYQVTGEAREEEQGPISLDISDEDLQMVVDQTGVTEDKARVALEDAHGDIAQAIMDLKS